MKTISFYSYKGGVGRTLLVANTARYLTRFSKRVVAIDFDLEAPGLHYKFGLGEDSTLDRAPELGLVDYMTEAIESRSAPGSLAPFTTSVKDRSGNIITLVPAGSVPSSDYWKKLARINWHDLFYSAKGIGVPLFLELKEQVQEEFKPDFLLIDSRTGITEVGGVATTLLPDTLVCLLLNNRENLEGARTVMRAVAATDRVGNENPPEIVPVLSRVPVVEDSEKEDTLTNEVLRVLNEEADPLELTLDFPEILLLHAEPRLGLGEFLHVGGSQSPEESVLLRDYLRLFSRIIDKEEFDPQIARLAGKAKERAFEDPEGAQRDLEALTHLGHPEAYRELLRFHRLRRTAPEIIIGIAENLWKSTGDNSDDILWTVIKENFRPVVPDDRHRRVLAARRQLRALKGDLDTVRFAEEVWRARGGADREVGMALAESYSAFEEVGARARVLGDLVSKLKRPDEEVVVSAVEALMAVGRLKPARDLVHSFDQEMGEEPAFLAVSARLAININDAELMGSIYERPGAVEAIAGVDVTTGLDFLGSIGKVEEARPLLVGLLRRQRSERYAVHLGMKIVDEALFGEFRAALTQVFDEDEYELILMEIRERKRNLGPSNRPRHLMREW